MIAANRAAKMPMRTKRFMRGLETSRRAAGVSATAGGR
jgi:hypothetical protein